LGIRDQEH